MFLTVAARPREALGSQERQFVCYMVSLGAVVVGYWSIFIQSLWPGTSSSDGAQGHASMRTLEPLKSRHRSPRQCSPGRAHLLTTAQLQRTHLFTAC